MKILFGVQTTGNGHVSRSREVIHALKSLGHEVRVILSGRDPHRFKDIAVLQPHDIFQGLTFSTSRGKLQYFQTAAELKPIRFYQDLLSCDASGIDLVVTDFEPLSARIARRFKLPLVGIGHQYAFCFDIPVAGANPVSRWVLRNFAPVAHPIGLHWHHFNQPILPPIIPPGLQNHRPVQAEKILVYLPFEEPEDTAALLRPLASHQFYVYGIAALERPVDRGHLHLRPFSRQGFLEDLMDCNGVICNAGFELASEAFHLGKRLLVKPLAGQLEQASNALAVSRLGLGRVMSELNRGTVQKWLHSPPGSPCGYPAVADLIARWIDRGRWDDLSGLAQEAWRQTQNIPRWEP